MRLRHIVILSEYNLNFKRYLVINETKDNLKIKNKKTGNIINLRY